MEAASRLLLHTRSAARSPLLCDGAGWSSRRRRRPQLAVAAAARRVHTMLPSTPEPAAAATLEITANSAAFNAIAAALAIFVSAAPLLSASLVAAPADALWQLVPLVGKVMSGLLRVVAKACEQLRTQRERTFVLLHGALTYSVGDLIAQAASSAPSSATLRWAPAKTARAAAIGIFTDALPFYHWSSFLARVDEPSSPSRAALLRRLPILERHPSLMLPLKTAAHLVSFQPLSTAGYLLFQGLAKRHTLPGALAFLRERFAAAALPALATFLVGGPFIYSLPVVAGAALRNIGVPPSPRLPPLASAPAAISLTLARSNLLVLTHAWATHARPPCLLRRALLTGVLGMCVYLAMVSR